MPIVQENPLGNVETQVTRQARASADVPSAAFGAPITQAVGALAKAGFETKARADEASAEEAAVQFEREKNNLFFNPDSGYFNTSGRNAFDNADAARKTMTDLKAQFGKDLNTEARRMFDRVADRHITRGDADISRHAAKGLEAWEIGGIQASVENSIENAALYWNDEAEMRIQNVAGRSSILELSERQGLGPEETAEKLQTFDSSFAETAITAAASSSAKEGRGMLEKLGNRLEGPSKVKMENKIKAKEKAEKTAEDARQAVITATNVSAIYTDDSTGEIDRNGALAEVNKIEDPERRKKTLTEVNHQLNAKKTAYSERRAQIFEDGEDFLIQGGSAEEFQAQNPESWELMSPKQKQAMQSGKIVQTDWGVYSDLVTKPREELAQVNPEEHFHQLAPSERKTLISAVKSAKGTGNTGDKVDSQAGRSRTAETTATVNEIFGRSSKRNKDEERQANAFYALVDSEVTAREAAKGSKLTSEEYTNLLGGLSRKVVQEGVIFDSEFDLTDIPAENVPQLSTFLRENNIPVTSDNLIKAYLQAR